MNLTQKDILKKCLRICALIIVCVSAVIFEYVFLNGNSSGFVYRNRSLLFVLCLLITVAISALSIYFSIQNNAFAYKICLLVLVTETLVFLLLYIYKASGIAQKISSIEKLREFISQYGAFAIPAFILLQILQVVVLPVPGFIAIGAGVALFGTFKGCVYSLIGILSGSFIAFFTGRFLGYKVVSWLVGEKSLNKALELVKGKDKVLLTTMFLFPFFPDDVLCFVAGLSTLSVKYFVVMIIITRVISVFTTGYSLGGQIIPYNTWWGILIWAILILATVALTAFIYKKGNDIEEFIKRKWKKRAE